MLAVFKPFIPVNPIRQLIRLSLIAFIAFPCNQSAIAQDKSGKLDAVLSGVGNDTFAIVQLPVQTDDDLMKTFSHQFFGTEYEQAFPKMIKQLEMAGVRQITCTIAYADCRYRFPGQVFVTEPGTATFDSIKQALVDLDLNVRQLGSMIAISRLAAVQHAAAGSASAEIAELDQREAESVDSLRQMFADALSTNDHSGIRLAICLGTDQRIVAHEFLPSIIGSLRQSAPADLSIPAFDVSGFVNEWNWLVIDIRTNEESRAELSVRVEMASALAANTFAKFAPAAFRGFLSRLVVPDNAMLKQLASLAVTATANDNHVDIQLVDEQGVDATESVLDASGIERDSMGIQNDLRQLAIAFHNYHDAYKHLPAIGNQADDGRHLLSWRVHVLPFIEQQELYVQFHLNEPWDSAHNKTLVEQMPDLFRARRSTNEVSKGLSNYLMPNGNGAMFRDYEPRRLQDITDGTSRTLMLVEVDDASAEVWTKPGGWAFDPQQPAHGLGGHIANRIHFARGDGSSGNIAPDNPTLPAMITSDAGDIP